MMGFEPTRATRPDDAPDAIDLELARLGVDTGPIDVDALAADVAALKSAEALFQARARPLMPRATPRRWPWAVGGALALAAAALLIAQVATGPADDGIRKMGGAGALHVALLEGPEPQTFFVEITSPDAGFLEVATVQDDGTVSILVAGDTLPAEAGQTLRVDGLVRLDDFAGREWLVVEHSAQALDAGAMEALLAGMLPDPTAHADADTLVVEVTRP